MKRLERSISALVMALATFPALLHAQGGLTVEAYPGAVAVISPQPGQEFECGRVRAWAHTSVFLSKDDASKIGAFYMPKAKDVWENAQYGSVSYVVDQWTTGEGTAWVGAEVFSGADAWTTGDFPLFSDLLQQVDGDNHTEEDYRAVHEEYRYLNTAFFDCSDERDESGARLDEAEAAIKRYHDARNAEGDDLVTSVDEVNAKIMKLTTEGRYEEAAILGQRLASGAMAFVDEDHWDEVVALIEQLGEKAYRTLIVLYNPPRDQ